MANPHASKRHAGKKTTHTPKKKMADVISVVVVKKRAHGSIPSNGDRYSL